MIDLIINNYHVENDNDGKYDDDWHPSFLLPYHGIIDIVKGSIQHVIPVPAGLSPNDPFLVFVKAMHLSDPPGKGCVYQKIGTDGPTVAGQERFAFGHVHDARPVPFHTAGKRTRGSRTVIASATDRSLG